MDRLAGPEPVEQAELLVEHLPPDPAVGFLADVLPLEGHCAGADAEGGGRR
jgi:hypothetical protein